MTSPPVYAGTSLNVEHDETNFLSPLLDDEKELASEYRSRKSVSEFRSVHPADAQSEEANGWTIQRVGKRASRLKRTKSHDKFLEDRIWCLLHRMGYRILNGAKFNISFIRGDGSLGKKQIDVYAEDVETAFVVECKSRQDRGRRSLQKDIQETISLQKYFRNSINKRFCDGPKPKIIWAYATNNILWSAPDIERAQADDIKIITENEIYYFEEFVKHMGPAGRYQILGEFLKGQKVPGLTNVKNYLSETLRQLRRARCRDRWLAGF